MNTEPKAPLQFTVKTDANEPPPLSDELVTRAARLLLAADDREAMRLTGLELLAAIGIRQATRRGGAGKAGASGRPGRWLNVSDPEYGVAWMRGVPAVAEALAESANAMSVALSRGGGVWARQRVTDNGERATVVRYATEAEAARLDAEGALPFKGAFLPEAAVKRARGAAVSNKKTVVRVETAAQRKAKVNAEYKRMKLARPKQ